MVRLIAVIMTRLVVLVPGSLGNLRRMLGLVSELFG
jgi:hypothetical protein